MLQFPVWKVCLILGIMLWGVMMALPNAVNMSGAPAGVPKQGVNLGLDLQGGVYLMMEINPNEVVANRLEVFAIDIRNALGNRDGQPLIGHLSEVDGRVLNVQLTRPDADGNFPVDEALTRIRKLNGSVEGAIGGAKTYEIEPAGPALITVSVPGSSEEALMKDALAKTMTIVRRRVEPGRQDDLQPCREQPFGHCGCRKGRREARLSPAVRA